MHTMASGRMARVLLAAWLLAGSLLAAMPARAETLIQPGAPINGCTMNFVFTDDSGAQYFGTAGHCVSGVGAGVGLGETRYGTVVWHEFDERIVPNDFALVRIDQGLHALVDPTMRFWGGPTGVTHPADGDLGDLIGYHGYGIPFGSIGPARARVGVLQNDNAQEYTSVSPATFGDSGGPVLLLKTGQALGIATRFGGSGPTVAYVLERMRAQFPSLELVTAPFQQ